MHDPHISLLKHTVKFKLDVGQWVRGVYAYRILGLGHVVQSS